MFVVLHVEMAVDVRPDKDNHISSHSLSWSGAFLKDKRATIPSSQGQASCLVVLLFAF